MHNGKPINPAFGYAALRPSRLASARWRDCFNRISTVSTNIPPAPNSEHSDERRLIERRPWRGGHDVEEQRGQCQIDHEAIQFRRCIRSQPIRLAACITCKDQREHRKNDFEKRSEKRRDQRRHEQRSEVNEVKSIAAQYVRRRAHSMKIAMKSQGERFRELREVSCMTRQKLTLKADCKYR